MLNLSQKFTSSYTHHFEEKAMSRLFLTFSFVVLFLTGSFFTDCFSQTSAWNKLALDSKFEQLQKNYYLDLQTEDSLYMSMPQDEWIAVNERRDKTLSLIRREDDKIIDEILSYYKSGNNIQPYQYDSLLSKTTQFYRLTQDAFITEHLVSFVLPFYKKTGDQEHLFQCDAVMGLALTQIAREGDTEEYFNALDYMNRAADYGYAHFMRFRYNDSFDYITRLYQELLHPRWLELRKQTIYEAYQRYNELKDLDVWLNDNPDLAVSSHIRQRTNSTYFDFEHNIVEYLMSEKSQNQNNPIIKLMAKFYKRQHDLEIEVQDRSHSGSYSIAKNEVLYHKVLHYTGLSSALQSFHAIDSIYQSLKGADDIEPIMIDLISFIKEAAYFLDITDELSEQEKEKYAMSYLQDLTSYTKRARDVRRQSKLYDQLESIVVDPHFYVRFSGDNRNDLLMNLLIKSDAEIYVHSMHVTWIGWNMMDVLLTEKPASLVGLLGCNTPEQVQAHQEEFHEFFWNACLTHDLGLNRMSPTTNLHYRSLTSHEAQLLRNHLIHGVSIISIDTYHARFYDQVIGHHKWYNGKGFPESFDNITSPYSIINDLLAITDFLEGGADLPAEGVPAAYDDRLTMLKELSGTRFNPELVNMFFKHYGVLTRTREICTIEKPQMRYELYKEYFNENPVK